MADGHSLEAGLRELARHRPDRALRLFREAVEECPASETGRLERSLYWQAVALLRLDRPELALKSLRSARDLRPRGLAASAWARRSNLYGMPRRSSSDLDDFYAFYSIQTCIFLSGRPGRRFASEAEKDTVTRLVAIAWQEVKRSGRLEGKGPEDRLELFRTWPKVFPHFVAGLPPSGRFPGEACACETIEVDFQAGARRGL